MIINKTLKRNRGFTLVETLVAISILLIAVVGPISLIGDALHKLYYAKDQMIAINLAQEGIEVVRQVRDSNMLSGVAWDTGIVSGTYVVDAFSSPAVFSCADTKVYQDANGYRQRCTVDNSTQFSSRTVVVTDIGSAPVVEKKVTSTVIWTTGGQVGTITATEYLFKWAI
jgi:prepilin-type N-terminal cleavage/methylation domain-containing protein